MSLALDPTVPVGRGVRRLVRRRLRDAIERVDRLAEGGVGADVEREVHEIRKRCKEARAVALLAVAGGEPTARRFERRIRRAAHELGGSRDAAVMRQTAESLVVLAASDSEAEAVRAVAASLQSDVGPTVPGADQLAEARRQLTKARRDAKRWDLPDDPRMLTDGLRQTAATARRWWRRSDRLDAPPMHAWRTANKRWWYQVRLVEEAAPDLIGPMAARLGELGERLGQVHDLDMLVDHVDVAVGDRAPELDVFLGVARRRREELAVACVRAGELVFAESPKDSADRLTSYWTLAAAAGGAPPVDPVEDRFWSASALDASPGHAELPPPSPSATAAPALPIERERKFVVNDLPASVVDTPGRQLRQGYLVVEDQLSVRIRSAGQGLGTFTVKAGAGRSRLELEWSIDDESFERLWPLTEGRRVDKIRRVFEEAGRAIEIDVFAGALDGLVLAEVEFDDETSMNAYEPPAWVGVEVSDDPRYTNARLALDGPPPGMTAGVRHQL